MIMIRILLAEDHAMVRAGLRLILERQPDMTVVGEAHNGSEAVALALQRQPTVVVLDIGLPDMNGLDALEQIKACSPQIRVMMLSGMENEQFLQRALQCGALGYVLKQGSAAHLVRAVRTVAQGGLAVDWFGSAEPADAHLPGGRSGLTLPAHSSLTGRECEVLRLVAQGYSNTDTAVRLGISPKTVDTHRTHVMEKLGVHTRADLTRYALQYGYMIVA